MGRRVFVTGGTGALGSAVTKRLLEDGHRVAVTCRHETEVADVPVPERAELLDVYRDRYGKMPTVGSVLDKLPDPADHPTFRITASRPAA